jgi:hypothetical protein
MKKSTLEELDQEGLIRTYTGQYLNFLDPQPEQITIEAIAIGLARTARFAGQSKNFYSVASHSIMVSDRIWEITQDKGMALMGLLHDASEAFLGDMPGTIKHVLTGYKLLEEKLMRVIFKKYNLDYTLMAGIKPTDKLVMCIEYETIINNNHFKEESEGALYTQFIKRFIFLYN